MHYVNYWGGNGLYEKEIIVVNDGSTDNTEKIVHDLALSYPDIVLITQENSGVASARNSGLRNATGNYIAWCDSDDYVEPEWLCNLYLRIKKYNADMSICRAKIKGHYVKYNPDEVIVWNRSEAIKEFLIEEKLNGTLWTKMFRRELFDNISFALDMSYWEDSFVVWKVLQKVQTIVRCNEGTYNYIVHSGSLCNAKINLNRVSSMLRLWDNIIVDCKLYHNEHLDLAIAKQYEYAISILGGMMKSSLYHCEFEQKLEMIVKSAGFKGVCKINGFTKRLFAIGLLMNMNMVRYLFNLRIKLKS